MNSSPEVFEDRLDLDIELLQSVSLTSNSPREQLAAYPFPYLVGTGKSQQISLRTVILENDYLRVTLLPDLGGRITSLFDKRVQAELLAQEFKFEERGPRGVELLQGIEFDLRPSSRRNRLGPVDFLLGDDEDMAQVTFGEIAGPLSWHIVLSLPADSALLQIEGRVMNRSWEGVAYGTSFVNHDDRGQVRFLTSAGGPWKEGCRFDEPQILMPHQLDVWGLQMLPVDGAVDAVSAVGALTVRTEEPGLRFQAARRVSGEMFVMVAGQTFSAAIDVLPEAPFEAPLAGAAEAVTIRDASGEELLRWTAGSVESPSLGLQPAGVHGHPGLRVGMSAGELEWAEFDLRTRGAAKVIRAIQAIRTSDWEGACVHLDDGLLVNAEDHFIWLLKAIVARKTGDETEDLLNAHYLAPLEPLLRMESFLSQNHQTAERSPLVGPLAESPDLLVEGAVFLSELGLFDDLSRWIDECLRHREVPLLRYILADALLEKSEMRVDAANHVQRAGEAPVNPPYPWRALELAVLRRISSAFPSDPRVADLIALMERAGS